MGLLFVKENFESFRCFGSLTFFFFACWLNHKNVFATRNKQVAICHFLFFVVDFNQDRLADIIHRGRDHGLPTYKQVREFCGLSPITAFEELNTTIEERVIANLRKTYQNVDDIDLFVGGLAERALSGAVVGPTFGCLLGQQFQILKKGDRFWYENNIPPSAYSKGNFSGL